MPPALSNGSIELVELALIDLADTVEVNGQTARNRPFGRIPLERFKKYPALRDTHQTLLSSFEKLAWMSTETRVVQIDSVDVQLHCVAHAFFDPFGFLLQQTDQRVEIDPFAGVRVIPFPVLGDGYKKTTGTAGFGGHVFRDKLVFQRIAQIAGGAVIG